MKIDSAAYLGPWPFRQVEGTLPGLTAMLHELGLDGALLSPLPALFHTDPADANRQFLRKLALSAPRDSSGRGLDAARPPVPI